MPDHDDTHDRYLHGHHDSVLRSHRRRSVENSAAYLASWTEKLASDPRMIVSAASDN